MSQLGQSQVAVPWQYAALAGLVPGVSRITALGNNPDVDTTTQPEDVWSGAELGVLNGTDHKDIQIPNGAVSVELVSSSAMDTTAGTGARTVTVTYVDANWAWKQVTLNMNGTTPVPLPETVRGINGLTVATAGTFKGANTGNISVRATGGLGVTYSYMQADVGTARSSLYTVPEGMTFDLLSLIVAINRTDTSSRWATFNLCLMNDVGRLIKTLELSASSEQPFSLERANYPLTSLPARNYAWLRCEAVSVNNTNVTGTLSGLLRTTIV